MAVVKISELPAMVDGAVAGSDLLPIVDTSETETKKITKQQLLTDINASEVQIGQLTEATQINDEDYLIITQDGTNKKISKANAKFASGEEVAVSTTQPTGEDAESVVLWINPNEDSVDAEGSYITNEYSEAIDKGYSCDYLNNSDSYSTSEIKTNKRWIDGKPIYRKAITMQNQASAQVEIGTITNLDALISLNGLLLSSTVKNIMGSHNDDTNYASRLYMYQNSIYYQQGSGWRSTDYTIQVIIEYTKTTD